MLASNAIHYNPEVTSYRLANWIFDQQALKKIYVLKSNKDI